MLLCRVEGSCTATIQHPTLKGWRMLLCQPIDENESNEGALLIAVDNLGAGMHQKVLVASDGKGIRERIGQDLCPVRYMTFGIID